MFYYCHLGNYHSIYLICKNHNIRNLLKNWFKKFNVETTSHYEPVHKSDFIKKLNPNKNKIDCNNAEDFSKKILRLPLHLYLKNTEIKKITFLLKKFDNQSYN